MRSLLILLGTFAAAATAAPAQQYDDFGNDPAFAGGPGAGAPGAVLGFVTGPWGPSSDLCHDGENLLVVSAYDGVGRIYHVKESTGATVATTTIGITSDFGLAWDDVRQIFVTSDPSADTLQGWSRAGALLFTYPYPGTGFVGVGWDCMRGVYWVCDWTTNMVHSVNPATGAIGFSFGTAGVGCTRPAGLAFDPISDTLYVGGRDTSMIYGFDPATGALRCTFGAQDGANNPQGCGMSTRGGVWHSSWNSALLYELEGCFPTHPSLTATPNFPTAGAGVTLAMSGLAPGHVAAFGYSITGCGPIPSPLGMLLLSPPASLLAMVPATAAGVASIVGVVPPALAGVTVYMHGGNMTAGVRCNNIVFTP